LGAISIVGILVIQSYWVVKTLDLRQQQFDETVQIALLNTAKELAKLTRTNLPSENLISRVSSNYYVVNLNNQINPGDLEFYLRREFEAVALKENFEFGIYDCASDEMVYGSFVSFDDGVDRYPPSAADREVLPKYDEFIYYFGVRFPNKRSYLLNTMLFTIIFSVILLLAIVYFVYSMYIILHQRQLSQMQRDFINNMTHEFKTPISTINIASEVLLKDSYVGSEERLRRYAEIIREQNRRLNQQVENVLQIAQLEKDKLIVHTTEISLNETLRIMLDSIEMKVQERGGELVLETQAKDDLILADPLHLTNIIYNLVDNAIKYSKDILFLKISTHNSGSGKVKLCIEDRGMGIKSEYLHTVFQKFYRVPTGNVHNVKGFGLGLYYVKLICDAHKWRIDLQSEENKGTLVSIEMPMAGFQNKKVKNQL
jgi:two-component system, OmpR family, phosphate regulon sensor histidine kinase PhoR